MVDEALEVVEKTGDHPDEAELYRLKGELILQKFPVSGFELQVQPQSKAKSKEQRKSSAASSQSSVPNLQPQILHPQAEAESHFLKAINVAQHQQAKLLELRATVSLARL